MNAYRNGKDLVGSDNKPFELDAAGLVKAEDIGRMKLCLKGYPEPSNPGHLQMAMYSTATLTEDDVRYSTFKKWHEDYNANRYGKSSNSNSNSNVAVTNALVNDLLTSIITSELSDDVKKVLVEKANAVLDPKIVQYKKYLEERGYTVTKL